jgi:hypothetical protein
MGPILAGNPGIIPRWSAGDHEINSANYPATLADEITLDSPREQRELIIRTADTVRNNHNTEPYILTGAFADYTVCGYNKSPVKIEDVSLLCDEILAAPERLLNSRSGRIHLFPVIPKDAVVAFRGCLARGGFEVSAAKNEQGVLGVLIKARRNARCRVMNPWTGKAVELTGPSGPVAFRLDRSNGECIEFDACAGGEYALARAK